MTNCPEIELENGLLKIKREEIEMKSLTYMFTHNPKYFYDCLDFARREHLIEVSLDLETTEIITTMAIGRQLIAMFEFNFASRRVRCERILGGCLADECEKKQLKGIEIANRKLERYLEKVQSVCPEIIGSEQRFDDTIIYKHSVIRSVAKNS
ncbi:hypothetical protein HOG48_03305 [Candidatus Peregrinibacteria bacterium]|nr:hypothetical protein [Candidatus Peregrinibacteria bacterium]